MLAVIFELYACFRATRAEGESKKEFTLQRKKWSNLAYSWHKLDDLTNRSCQAVPFNFPFNFITRVASLSVESASTLQALTARAFKGRLAKALRTKAAMLPELPVVYMGEEVARANRQVATSLSLPFTLTPGVPMIRALSRTREPVTIGELRYPDVYHPKIVV